MQDVGVSHCESVNN